MLNLVVHKVTTGLWRV